MNTELDFTDMQGSELKVHTSRGSVNFLRAVTTQP